MIEIRNFYNGEFHGPVDGRYLDSFAPATGEVHAHVPDSTEADVNAAVESASKAFPAWSKATRQFRSKCLSRLADLLEARLDEFAQAESQDQGKPVSLAKRIDIPRAVLNFRFFAENINHLEEKATELDGVAFNYVHRKPCGVAALIAPWNLPLYLLTWKLAPALAAGCTVVAKPSEFTSVTAFMLCSLVVEAGFPPGMCFAAIYRSGVVNIIFGRGQPAGAALVQHPNVPVISFTGGTATGESIYRSCVPKFKKTSLELGGKNANIVFADCSFEEAIAGSVQAAFTNQGEICLCGSRIFVESTIFPKFLSAFIEKAKQLRMGDPGDPSTDLGALVSLQHLNNVLRYVDIARKEGGKIWTGGQRVQMPKFEDGYWMEPTIITELSPSSTCCQQEIFGPVVTLVPFEGEEQAVEFANGTIYGLSASVWTENGRRAQRVAHQLNVGTVWVNCWMVRDLHMPFGGVKMSGIGREGYNYSIRFFTEETAVVLKY
ncbi:betaine-aldehyde dehydrogenase [Polychytrium aggregatum]|uniref:betaine-aldehyde dehydrogenase n=1 Tax=Polychytrium aggregatum TaxID=110093 RepID=UPI0022FF036F|nr:betaine-aldehyde dehydrogenase [Polychytrium aggregatum]KAI9202657.1 betaine-aldehyde dehydrogenase [Polychytrium aggregatum]